MPVFHTKTIESILDPVAQQVSRLVLVHEDFEDGCVMPDLEQPVMTVSRAVSKLVTVGRDTIDQSDDVILRQEMPASLQRIDRSSHLLEEASRLLKEDACSEMARKNLIDGSRGILQGTSSLLLCLDESEVRRIVRECKKVLEYLAVAEVIESSDDLLQFVKDISSCLPKVFCLVDARQKELTHQVHRDILVYCLEQLKTLTPIMISSMKIYVQLRGSTSMKGVEEACENRDYLTARMSDEIHEIIRVLQLTTYDEDEWNTDDLTVARKIENTIASKLLPAVGWLQDPAAKPGGSGEKELRTVLDLSDKVAELVAPDDAARLKELTSGIRAKLDSLVVARQNGQGHTPQSSQLAMELCEDMKALQSSVKGAIESVGRSGQQQPAHTLEGRLEQVASWLQFPGSESASQLGQHALQLVVNDALAAAETLPPPQRQLVLGLCREIEDLSASAAEAARTGQSALGVSTKLADKLQQLKDVLQDGLVGRVVEDFVDVTSPVNEFHAAATADQGVEGRQKNFDNKTENVEKQGALSAHTGLMAALSGQRTNKQLCQQIRACADEVNSLRPQMIRAGRIRLQNPRLMLADEHFNIVKQQYVDNITRLRSLADETIDPHNFIKQSKILMEKTTGQCEEGVKCRDPIMIVDNAANVAKLCDRVLMIAKKEASNSEDPVYTARIQSSIGQIESNLAPMIRSAKAVALNPSDHTAINTWRQNNSKLVDSVSNLGDTISSVNPVLPSLAQLKLADVVPPRPPSPSVGILPPRPPLPNEDVEDSPLLRQAPPQNQPILAAAHGLHQEVAQWSSEDNDIIAAAKRMAQQMAHFSQLMREESANKRGLIDCAKQIVESSEEVTRLAKHLAHQCTDKRLRTQMLQVCERIPTIGTQLKILSTVKATMFGARGTEEDQEATDMLVGNAQNLMQAVKETVRAAEAASIKLRTEAGISLRWERKPVWYQ